MAQAGAFASAVCYLLFMKELTDQIRALLSQIDDQALRTAESRTFRVLSGLELPDIITDVVDLLMPELRSAEVAFYMYFLRHSIVANGEPYFRVSRTALQSGVVKPAYNSDSGGGEISLPAVRETLTRLTNAGAIRQEGEANRQGTLYRLLLPEEIESCQRRRAEQRQRSTIVAIENEADFYNVRENRIKIYERDNYRCTYCDKQLTRFTATLDHITPVSEGGDNSAENLKTACLACNSRKTARPLGDFLADSFPTS